MQVRVSCSFQTVYLKNTKVGSPNFVGEGRQEGLYLANLADWLHLSLLGWFSVSELHQCFHFWFLCFFVFPFNKEYHKYHIKNRSVREENSILNVRYVLESIMNYDRMGNRF